MYMKKRLLGTSFTFTLNNFNTNSIYNAIPNKAINTTHILYLNAARIFPRNKNAIALVPPQAGQSIPVREYKLQSPAILKTRTIISTNTAAKATVKGIINDIIIRVFLDIIITMNTAS